MDNVAETNPWAKMDSLTTKLGNDVLWRVFWINADMDQESEKELPALTTLRCSSQVCSIWRDLIVASPSLWAQVLDFDQLQQEDWKKEVINRTGNSDLYVRGDSHLWQTAIEGAVISILGENWTQVRSLALDFNAVDAKLFHKNSDLWCLLRRLAKILETFEIKLLTDNADEEDGEIILSPPKFMIFDNYAPCLKVFVTRNIQFDFWAPWISQIRRLGLNAKVPIRVLLEALSHMPLLETLEDNSCAITLDDADGLPLIQLPRLQEISIYNTLDITPYMTFLAQIEPLESRLLSFYHNSCRMAFDPDTQTIPSISKVLFVYTKQAEVLLSASTQIYLQFAEKFSFSADLLGGRSFNFDLDAEELPDHAYKDFLSALNFLHFPHLYTLCLLLRDNCGILPSDPKLATFITSASSIKILTTSGETLQFLLRLPEEVLRGAFPALRRITTRFPTSEDVGRFRAFLAFRKMIGRPISTLSIGLSRLESHDWTSLDEISGLRVKVVNPHCVTDEGKHPTLKKYICGSGRPKTLLIPRAKRQSREQVLSRISMLYVTE